MTAQTNAPIIIKRKKVIVSGGHHGGAWKVAYADFVTAMMAFFMLMWLLNATTDQQKNGIADYFSPTIVISRQSGGGESMLSGDTLTKIDTAAQTATGGLADMDGASGVGFAEAKDASALEDLESAVFGQGGESNLTSNAMRHVLTRLTDEGLVITLFDLPDAPLFVDETDVPMPITGEIVAFLGPLLGVVENGVGIDGHVRQQSFLRINYPVWDLSTSRAARLRVMLTQAGLAQDRIARQTGEGDRVPAAADPQSLRNNRIEIIVLRSDV